MKEEKVVIPDNIMRNIRKDIRDYIRHQYSFAMFLENNTYGRWYGKELKKVWNEIEKNEEVNK